LEKINKIDKPLAGLIKEIEERKQIILLHRVLIV